MENVAWAWHRETAHRLGGRATLEMAETIKHEPLCKKTGLTGFQVQHKLTCTVSEEG